MYNVNSRFLEKLDHSKGPKHVGIIMDGNGRWAKQQGLPVSSGHYEGYKKLTSLLETVILTPVNVLSLYSLSVNNITSRPEAEIKYLFELISTGLKEILKDPRIKEHNLEVIVSGRKSMLPDNVREEIERAEKATEWNGGKVLNFCIAYDGHTELVDATRKVCEGVLKKEINIGDIDESVIKKALYGGERIPEMDLMIRTGSNKGQRISGFMLWDASYAEMIFTPTLWPDFSSKEFLEILLHFQNPDKTYRTFGARASEQ